MGEVREPAVLEMGDGKRMLMFGHVLVLVLSLLIAIRITLPLLLHLVPHSRSQKFDVTGLPRRSFSKSMPALSRSFTKSLLLPRKSFNESLLICQWILMSVIEDFRWYSAKASLSD